MRFTLRIPDNEGELLDKHCQQTGRNKTDILREYIRTLPYRSSQPPADQWLLAERIIQQLGVNGLLPAGADIGVWTTIVHHVVASYEGRKSERKAPAGPLFALDTEAIAIEAVVVLVSKGLTNGHPDIVATYIKQVIDTHAKTN